jgi:type II secretory ATPase GspE/PulE/Tfp pilus assembly ATPase PilB-like protein
VRSWKCFEIDKEMQHIILKSPGEQEIYEAARRKGMITIREDAIFKCMKGEVAIARNIQFLILTL